MWLTRGCHCLKIKCKLFMVKKAFSSLVNSTYLGLQWYSNREIHITLWQMCGSHLNSCSFTATQQWTTFVRQHALCTQLAPVVLQWNIQHLNACTLRGVNIQTSISLAGVLSSCVVFECVHLPDRLKEKLWFPCLLWVMLWTGARRPGPLCAGNWPILCKSHWGPEQPDTDTFVVAAVDVWPVRQKLDETQEIPDPLPGSCWTTCLFHPEISRQVHPDSFPLERGTGAWQRLPTLLWELTEIKGRHL